MKRPLILHPYLTAAGPICYLYANNIEIVPAAQVVAPLILALSLSFLFMFIFGWLLKDKVKGALLASVAAAGFFTYGHIYELVFHWLTVNPPSGFMKIIAQYVNWNLLLVPAYLLAGAILARLVIRSKRPLLRLTQALNLATATFLMISISSIALHVAGPKPDVVRPSREAEMQEGRLGREPDSPDIYYIILDGYAREDILREFFGYDNGEFLNELRERGFYVADLSRSNYFWTFLSLASSLNLRHLNDVAEEQGKKSSDLGVLFKMIQDSEAVRFLKSKNYRYVHLKSTWGPTQSNRMADVQIPSRRSATAKEFNRVLISTTMLRLLHGPFVKDLARWHMDNFEALKNVPSLTGPKFVFAHITIPHHPYLFDRDGYVLKRAYLSFIDKEGWEGADKYVDQLIFVNRNIVAVVRAILEKSPSPPIIIIQADHGPLLLEVDRDTRARARASILNAIYLPRGKGPLYETMTPVNIFRLIFNEYFGASFPAADDISYESTFQRPYDLSLVR